MRNSVKSLLAIGTLLILLGLVSIATPLALQWMIIIGVVFFIVAYFVHRGHKKEDQRVREARESIRSNRR